MSELNTPDEPETETYEHVADDGGTEITFTFEADLDRAQIRWTAEWDGGEKSGFTDEISDKHGAIIYSRSPRINGEKTRGSKLDDDMLEALKADLEAAEEYREAKREVERQQQLAEDLELTVGEISFETGTHRTKYSRSARVLQPSKDERHWTDDEADVVAALSRELGEANGLPRAEADEDDSNPFDAVDDGTTLSLDEAATLVDGVENTLDELADEREREAALEELRDDHPSLRGVGVDPDDVEAGFAEAAETGELVTVATGTGQCLDPEKECNLDRLSYRATPGGEIDVERTHTF